MITVGFAEQDELFIKQQVASGIYSSAAELIKEAVRHLRESQQDNAELIAALELGERDIEEGRYTVYYDGFFDDMVEKVKEMAARGEKPERPGVIPF